MLFTCYPPCQVIGGLYGRLLVVDAEVHHVDVTIAGAGGWWRQQALQIQGECAVVRDETKSESLQMSHWETSDRELRDL